jgi:hypothetical protein
MNILYITIIILLLLGLGGILAHNYQTNSKSAINSEKPKSISQVSTSTPPDIYFQIDSGVPTNCGETCRQTTATLTNTGIETAHNVNINININNNAGTNVYSHQESLGDIQSGQSISRALTINANCGFLYKDCVGNMPLTMNVEITWDGGNQKFTKKFSG